MLEILSQILNQDFRPFLLVLKPCILLPFLLKLINQSKYKEGLNYRHLLGKLDLLSHPKPAFSF
jgi:hypothetical protein